MQTNEQVATDADNLIAYDGLVAAISASQGVLSLLLAVCDDPQLREATIKQYEAELQSVLRHYRIELPRTEPSLRRVIAETIAQDSYLQGGGPAVFTVMGAEGLSFLTFGTEKSEQDTFLGYLQWTREGLREFPYPIVLWVTTQLLAKLSRKAPDFWSWRKDVFRFTSHKTTIVPSHELERWHPILEQFGEALPTEDDAIPLEDLRHLIAQTEARLGNDRNDKLLATLYSRMGKLCVDRAQQGRAVQYPAELQEALEYFRKAAAIQEALDLNTDLSTSLNDLALLYRAQSLYSEAEPLYVKSLSIREQQLGKYHPAVATSLSNLAALYNSQRRYTEAELLYVRSLSIREQQLGQNHPDVASSLNDLANLYRVQGRYVEAEPLYVRSLSIWEQQLGQNHPDVAIGLNNLAGLYESQGRYVEAEPLYVRSLSIWEQQLGKDHPDVAIGLNNLAELYRTQGRYSEAEPLLVRSLSIWEQQLGKDHPAVATSLNNLAELYRTQGRYSEAEPLYIEGLRILSQLSEQQGFEHPNLQTSLQNFYSFVAKVLQEGRQTELSDYSGT
jgi:tetratricopeptide (TPR) repeat protein